MKNFDLYADGGSRGNPGPAGIGVVVYEKEKKIKEFGKYIGIATNNVAEYLAVVYGLQECLFLKADKVKLHVDSQLVSEQLKGEYRVKSKEIKPLFEIARHLVDGIKKVEIIHIPRDNNKEADKLVNKAINLESLI